MILQMIVSAAGVAITAIVARRKGEGDEEGLNSCIKQSLLIIRDFYIFFLLCLGSFIFFSENIVSFAGANEDYIESCKHLFSIHYVTLLFLRLYVVILSSLQ